MSSKYYRNHRCSYCGGNHSRNTNCQSPGFELDNCHRFGPFRAPDANCIPPSLNTTTGSIIPYASGLLPVELVTLADGLVDTVSLVGFGTSVPGVSLLGGLIDLTPVVGTILNEAFTVPRTGTVTAISATFSVLAGLAVAGDVTVNAQIYINKAGSGDNIFTPTEVSVDLAPSLAGLAIGDVVSGSASNFSLPVEAGDRLLMVFSASGTTLAIATITGTASAGITID